jgi:hypothetical protein
VSKIPLKLILTLPELEPSSGVYPKQLSSYPIRAKPGMSSSRTLKLPSAVTPPPEELTAQPSLIPIVELNACVPALKGESTTFLPSCVAMSKVSTNKPVLLIPPIPVSVKLSAVTPSRYELVKAELS